MARRALIVATGTYEDAKLRSLRSPAADARGLAAVLEDPEIGDFAVETMLDANERDLRRRVARFLGEARHEDVLLLHLSCHGIKDERGGLYFAASDSEIDYPNATALAADWLNEQISHSPSRRIVLLLDCCFSGRFPFGKHRAGDRVNVQEHFEGRGYAVITASNAMEYAFDGDDRSGEGRPSYFTQAVIDALRTGEADLDGDHWISVDELYEYVFDHVKISTSNQTPNKQSSLEGPLHVAHSTYSAPSTTDASSAQPAELDESILALAGSSLAEARLAATKALTQLLASSNPLLAKAARERLEGMINDRSERVRVQARTALGTETPTQALKRHDGAVVAVAFSPDGCELASADSWAVRIWNTGKAAPRAPTRTLKNLHGVRAVAFSPHARQLVIAQHNGIRLCDLSTGKYVLHLQGTR